jgi:hypothetical protein
LPQALARVRNDVLSRKIDFNRARTTLVPRMVTTIVSVPARAYLAAALCVMIGGIAMNALLLQRGRHPAPLFGSTRPLSIPAPRKSASENPVTLGESPVEMPAAAAAAATAPMPVAAPAPPMSRAASRRSGDPIAELLHQEKDEEIDRLLPAARNALVKLGYSLKSDSNYATVREAVREFERSHGLPLTENITPHIVRRLSESAHAAQR